jgi:peptide chain release factor 1
VKPSIHDRLQLAASRHEEVGLLLSQPDVFSDQNRFRELSREYAQLEPLIRAWREWLAAQASIDEAEQILGESDRDMRDMAEEELRTATERQEALENDIQLLLLPKE